MADMTRRQLLGRSLGAATAGAALVGGATVLPRLVAGVADAGTTPSPASTQADLVVHVSPGSSGELRVMSGGTDVVVKDQRLVSRLRSAIA